MSVLPIDMRADTDRLLARIVMEFGEAHPHHEYLFANQRATRMKLSIHDGIGTWLPTHPASRHLGIAAPSLSEISSRLRSIPAWHDPWPPCIRQWHETFRSSGRPSAPVPGAQKKGASWAPYFSSIRSFQDLFCCP
jgi:hypothetical protein